MQEGDTELGGLQIPHGNNVNPPTPTPGPQPVTSATPQNPQPTSQPPQFRFQARPQFPAQAAPITSGASDIILGSTPPKKSKKPLIVTIIIILITIVAGVLAYFIFQQNNNNSVEPIATSATNYREAFNEYANYILYGEDSLKNIANTYESDTSYAIWQAADEKNETFFNKAKALFNNIVEQLRNSESDIDLVLFNGYANVFDFYYLYNTSPGISNINILEKYIQDGEEATSEYINNNYKVFEESSNLAQSYARSQKELDLLTLEQISIAYSNDCIENGTIDQNCLDSLEINFLEQKYDLQKNVQSITYDASRDIVIGCFTVADSIYYPEKEQNNAE